MMRRARVAIAAVFLCDGLLLGSWASRIPAAQAHTGLTNSRLGLALFASSFGALVAMPVAGWLSARIGSRRVSVAGLLTAAFAIAGTSQASGLVSLASALFMFGAGFGSVNVAANAQGIALERIYGRSILSSFHAAFSLGGLLGAGSGALMAAISVAPRAHFASVLIVVATATLAARRNLLTRDIDVAHMQRTLVRPPRVLLALGIAAFCTLLAEGAAADWSAAFLTQSVGVTGGVAGLGYTAFSLAMVASRTLGDELTRRVGAVTLARAGGAIAASGLAAGLLIASAPIALLGFAAMGLGLGVIVPVLFRAAGSTPGVTASVGVAAVSTIGWLGFLAGPPSIGFVAGGIGLRWALAIVVVVTGALTFLAGAAAQRTRREPRALRLAAGAAGRLGHRPCS